MHKLLISLGCNQTSPWGDATSTISTAIERIAKTFNAEPSVSQFFQSPAFPAGSGPDYVNAALAIYSGDAPRVVLSKLHAIEEDAARHRQMRWGPRTLDLDLIAYADRVLPDSGTWSDWHDLPLERQMTEAPDQLILPHPRMQDRAFVLLPLSQVAADWRHPVLNETVEQLLAAIPAAEIAALKPLPG